ncbi:hypothetical protein M5K25_009109 [Dendrobium thyrsiflorum]|uniref:Uncharacterized protein n=1 Tax=Dendrobium thyrsiflorum TaxID=117978 RepID=A0ABD0V4Q6_DENTH
MEEPKKRTLTAGELRRCSGSNFTAGELPSLVPIRQIGNVVEQSEAEQQHSISPCVIARQTPFRGYFCTMNPRPLLATASFCRSGRGCLLYQMLRQKQSCRLEVGMLICFRNILRIPLVLNLGSLVETLFFGGCGNSLPLLNCTCATSSDSNLFEAVFSSESAIVASRDSPVDSESSCRFTCSICDAMSGSVSSSLGKYKSSSELDVNALSPVPIACLGRSPPSEKARESFGSSAYHSKGIPVKPLTNCRNNKASLPPASASKLAYPSAGPFRRWILGYEVQVSRPDVLPAELVVVLPFFQLPQQMITFLWEGSNSLSGQGGCVSSHHKYFASVNNPLCSNGFRLGQSFKHRSSSLRNIPCSGLRCWQIRTRHSSPCSNCRKIKASKLDGSSSTTSVDDSICQLDSGSSSQMDGNRGVLLIHSAQVKEWEVSNCVGTAPVSHPTALEKSAYRRSAGPSRKPKKRLLDHPLRQKHRDTLPPTTLIKTCISGRFVALQESKMGTQSFRIYGIWPKEAANRRKLPSQLAAPVASSDQTRKERRPKGRGRTETEEPKKRTLTAGELRRCSGSNFTAGELPSLVPIRKIENVVERSEAEQQRRSQRKRSIGRRLPPQHASSRRWSRSNRAGLSHQMLAYCKQQEQISDAIPEHQYPSLCSNAPGVTVPRHLALGWRGENECALWRQAMPPLRSAMAQMKRFWKNLEIFKEHNGTRELNAMALSQISGF